MNDMTEQPRTGAKKPGAGAKKRQERRQHIITLKRRSEHLRAQIEKFPDSPSRSWDERELSALEFALEVIGAPLVIPIDAGELPEHPASRNGVDRTTRLRKRAEYLADDPRSYSKAERSALLWAVRCLLELVPPLPPRSQPGDAKDETDTPPQTPPR